MRESRTEASRKDRAERVPLGMKRRKLKVHNQDPAFVYRWINDVGGRVAEAERGGYEFVSADVKAGDSDMANRNGSTGDRNSRISGTDDYGKPIHAYLMRIRKDWYEADQKDKQRNIDAIDASIKRGSSGGAVVEQSYIPAQGISISAEKGESGA